MTALYWTDHYGVDWLVCRCLQQWLPAYERELLRRGLIRSCIDVTQTIGTYGKSSDTHRTGGAYDLFHQVTDKHIRIARKMGAASWRRDPSQGFVLHHHGVLNGCPHAHPAARGQGEDYKRGGNGLIGKARRVLPIRRKLRTWEEGIAWAKVKAGPGVKPYPVTFWNPNRWKWTGPVALPGRRDPIEVRNLVGFSMAPYFELFTDRLRFFCPVGPEFVTTPGSDNTRSELRQLTDGKEAAWPTTGRQRGVSGEFAVNRLPDRKRGSAYAPGVVVAQIHDDEDDVVMLVVRKSGIYASWSKGKGKGSEDVLLLADYQLGQHVFFVIAAAHGVVSVRVNTHLTTRRIDTDDCYAKAGAYCRGNWSNATGAAEVDYFTLAEVA